MGSGVFDTAGGNERGHMSQQYGGRPGLVHDAKGGLLKDFPTTYQLVRMTEHWRIPSYVNHD